VTWLRHHGWEWCAGTRTHILWFWPLVHVSDEHDEPELAFNLTRR
jgi:hypothetical protein